MCSISSGSNVTSREVIIVDDGSTDATYNILNDLGFNSISTPKTVLRYIFQKNQGVSSARNLGIKEAKSEYIALLDSDDLWLKGKLDRQIIAFRDDIQNRRLCHTDEIWVRNGIRVNQHKKHKKSGGNVFQSCLKLCCIPQVQQCFIGLFLKTMVFLMRTYRMRGL